MNKVVIDIYNDTLKKDPYFRQMIHYPIPIVNIAKVNC